MNIYLVKKPVVLMKDGRLLGGGLPTLLIYEGMIIEKNLKGLGYNKKWLLKQLQKKGIGEVEDIYTAMIDTSGELYYSVKE